jgi:hypothetical protein
MDVVVPDDELGEQLLPKGAAVETADDDGDATEPYLGLALNIVYMAVPAALSLALEYSATIISLRCVCRGFVIVPVEEGVAVLNDLRECASVCSWRRCVRSCGVAVGQWHTAAASSHPRLCSPLRVSSQSPLH